MTMITSGERTLMTNFFKKCELIDYNANISYYQ